MPGRLAIRFCSPLIPNSFLFAYLLAGIFSSPVTARELYVDNRGGDDGFDGRTPEPVNSTTGPVRSIQKVMEFIGPGDTIILANRGEPYYESLQLIGSRMSGLGDRPLIVIGNGAILSGARLVQPDMWKQADLNGLWRMDPRRKGFFQLLQGMTPVPEIVVPRRTFALPEIPPGSWCAFRGLIYYRARPEPGQSPPELPLAIAYEDVGITLLGVRNVIIRDLTIQHFRLDGINAHDRSRNVILEKVRLLQNGRAGLAVGGSSLVGLKDSELAGNRLAQIVNSEMAQTEIVDCKFVDGPGATVKITGGHVLIDGTEIEERP